MSIRSRFVFALTLVAFVAVGGCASTKSSVPEYENLTISQILARTPNLSVTLGLIDTADLERLLGGSNDPKYTLFAPTDAAWMDYGSDRVAELRDPANREQLIELLGRHIAMGEFSSRLLGSTSRPLNTRAKTGLTVAGSDADGYTAAGVPIIKLNMKATNGYIHTVGKVLP